MHSRIYPLIRVLLGAATTAVLSAVLLAGIADGQDAELWFAEAGPQSVVSDISSSRPYTTATYAIHLPLVFGPPPQPPPLLIKNGDFESGRVNWSEYAALGQVLIRSQADLGVASHGGSWAVGLGPSDNEVSMLSQGVKIPADHACLVYWQWTVSSDACNADYGGIGVNGNWLDVFNLCSGTATAGWVRRQITMADYTTNSVTINVAVVNDYSLPSALYVDDISLQPTAQCVSAVATTWPDVAADLTVQKMRGRPIAGQLSWLAR